MKITFDDGSWLETDLEGAKVTVGPSVPDHPDNPLVDLAEVMEHVARQVRELLARTESLRE